MLLLESDVTSMAFVSCSLWSYFIPRFTEVSQWQDVLEQCLQAVENEIAKLTEEKCATERELESLTLQLNTAAQCIRQRDSRYGNDLVLSDEGDSELKNVRNSFIYINFEDFHSGECLDCGLLDCDMAYSWKQKPMFHRDIIYILVFHDG